MKRAPKGRPLRLLFQDEARFGRISDRRRCWAPWPSRPVVASQIVREFLYASAAVCPWDGQLSSLVLPWVDTDTMSRFLTHTAQRFAADHCIMFLDGAGWHTANALRPHPNIQLEFLPSWSPELNPTEALWECLREDYIAHQVFDSLDQVEDCVCAGLHALHNNPRRVQSMTNFRWLKTLSMT